MKDKIEQAKQNFVKYSILELNMVGNILGGLAMGGFIFYILFGWVF